MSTDMTSRMSDLSNMMNPEQADTQAQVVTSIAPAPAPKLTLDAVREKLAGQSGRRYWKNLNELADTPEFNAMMQEEFPRQAMQGEWVDAVSRRGFLKVMGASSHLPASRVAPSSRTSRSTPTSSSRRTWSSASRCTLRRHFLSRPVPSRFS